MECYWNRTTETTLAKLRKASKGVAVVPLASIESHGPHLPLGSDTHCIEHVVELVVRKETVAVLPTVQYSCVASARALPGAIHMRSDLLMEMVENICDEVHRNGFDKVVLLHGHGGNVFLDQAFIRRMQEKEKPYAVYSIPVLAGIGEDIDSLMESEHIGHACEFETSLNMVACPDLVNLKALGRRTYPTHPAPDVGTAITTVDWISQHPEMVVGEPRKASEEKGKEIARLWSESLITHLRLIKRDRITPRTAKSYVRRVHAVGKEKE